MSEEKIGKLWIKTSTTKTVVNFCSSCTEQRVEAERGIVGLPFSPAQVCHTSSTCVPFGLDSTVIYSMDALSPDTWELATLSFVAGHGIQLYPCTQGQNVWHGKMVSPVILRASR